MLAATIGVAGSRTAARTLTVNDGTKRRGAGHTQGRRDTKTDGDQDQDKMEANNQGQEEVEAQVIDAQGVFSPPQRLTRSQFKALGNNGRLFSLFIVSCVIKSA